jgi:hypothetical protein
MFKDDFLIENPNKYGRDTFNDISELADNLAGRKPSKHSNPVANPQPQRTQDVDESFWDAVRDQSRKYGASD